MKWRKIGKIFDPTDHVLPNQCIEYAQGPQALVYDDFIRIYFSTRARDNGKYLSHVCFADFNKDLSKVIHLSAAPVICLGGLGCFDEHGIFPMNVLRHNEKIYGYTCGWSRRVSVSVDTSIGLAISSDDGLTFQRTGSGPILSSSLNEPFLVGDPYVRIFNDVFHMWYMFGTQWKNFGEHSPADRIYKIGHATSQDGFEWTAEDGRRIISDRLGSEECQAYPAVFRRCDRYHMVFCYREASNFRQNSRRGYRLDYAYSDDLINWKRDSANVGISPSAGEWDSDMMCYPSVFESDGKVLMLYNGNEFGRFGFGAAILE